MTNSPYLNPDGKWVIDLDNGQRLSFVTKSEAYAALKDVLNVSERQQFIANFVSQLRTMYQTQKTLLLAIDTLTKKSITFTEEDFGSSNFTQADFEAATITLTKVLTGVPDDASVMLYKVLPLEVGR